MAVAEVKESCSEGGESERTKGGAEAPPICFGWSDSVGAVPILGTSDPTSQGGTKGSTFGGELVVEVPAEGFDFLEDVEVWEVAKELEDEEFVEGFVEGIAVEVVLEVVENGAGSRVDIGRGFEEAGHRNSLDSEKQVLSGGGDEGGVDSGSGFDSGELEGLESEMVDGAEVAAGEFEDGVDGLRVEGEVFGAGDAETVLHVVEGFGAGEKPEGSEVSHAPADGLELRSVEKDAKLSVAGEDKTKNES
jgi:hypothetical protein